MGTSILERIIEPQMGGFSKEHARYVLSLDFSTDEQARYAKLAEKVQNIGLTETEEAELEEFVAANALLTILQSKARISLRKHGSTELLSGSVVAITTTLPREDFSDWK